MRYSLEDRADNRINAVAAVYKDESKDLIRESNTHRCGVCGEEKTCTTILDFDNLLRKNMLNIKYDYKFNQCVALYDRKEEFNLVKRM